MNTTMLKTIALSLTIVLLFASCGAGDKPSGGTTDQTNTDKPQAEPENNPRLLDKQALYKAKLYEGLEAALAEPDKVIRLKIAYKKLTPAGAFPLDVFKLKNLQELVIEANGIPSIPDNIGDLKDLQILKLNGNPITAVPSNIGNLKYLRIFELNNAKIGSYPASIGDLPNLEQITCVSCALNTFPVELTRNSKIKDINFNSNELPSIPAEISKLSKLEELGVMFNKITAIPAEIGKLSNLRRLLANDNKITELPASIGDLSNLTYLSVNANALSKLPESLSKLEKLRDLYIGKNKDMDYAQACTVVSTIPNLSTLSLSIMSGTMGGEMELPKEITKIKVKSLDLGFNKFKNPDADFALIAQIQGLETLTLFSCKLEKVPAPLFKMTGLKYLTLSSNPLKKPDFQKLVKALPKTNIPDIFK